MNMTILKRVFYLAILIILGLTFTVIYLNKTKDVITQPYFSHVRKKESLLTTVLSSNEVFSTELYWTYECKNNRCTRKFFSQTDKDRVSFLTCSMTCGNEIKIWPKPLNSRNQKSIKYFDLKNMKYQIRTDFQHVDILLHKAMKIFMTDIRQIVRAPGGRMTENIDEENKVANDTSEIKINLHASQSDAILLTLETDECYSLSVSATDENLVNVDISGKTFFGVRHGIETLQQLIWYDNVREHMSVLSSLNITDCPHFSYRGLMLDTSRHYFSVATIKRIINGMSRVKLNRFHWHMTDSQSFPFVSKNYPELSIYGAYSSEEVYTHEDVADIVEFAQVRGIQVIPEIDAPAHTGNGWQWGNEKGLGNLSLCVNQQPWMSFCGEPPCGQLNPKNKNTFMILESLYEELINLTKTTDFFHMGGDEVNFDCWKQYFKNEDPNKLWCNFMVEAHERMIKANNNTNIKYATIWNSDWSKIKCLPAEKFSLQVWLAQPNQIQQFLKANYNLIISHVDAWYLDCGFGSWRDARGVGTCPPYKAWYKMYSYRPWEEMRLSNQQRKQILGGEACMWTEQVNEDSIDARIWPRAAAFAERLWSDPDSIVIPKDTVDRFSIFQKRFHALGLKADALFPKYCEQNEEECM